MTRSDSFSPIDATSLSRQIKSRAIELGFQQTGITDTHLVPHIERYQNWLEADCHGEMGYMYKHGSKRWRPQELVAGTLRVISVRMDYLSDPKPPQSVLNQSDKAYISRYSLGRDYHKVIRSRLKKLIHFIRQIAKNADFRVFVDSAPVLERALAQKAGLGWFGKNTMIINRSAGSWFFLGEIYTNLPLPLDRAYDKEHCGHCTACLDICPTQAFVGPYILDARRCISYLTIELKGSIPVELRSKMGNRIFGCDDCQLVCPWNRFSKASTEPDFTPRHKLDQASLITLFNWDEATFLRNTEGSAIRRAGYESWLRNIAVALGNAPSTQETIATLESKQAIRNKIVREHITWALEQHKTKRLTP